MACLEERRAEVSRLATDVFGDADLAQSWMLEPAIGLNQQVPADLVESAEGADLVETYLMQIEYGVYV